MILADIAPRGPSPATWIALVVALLVVALVVVIMRPLRGWKRFAARHGLSYSSTAMRGEVAGRSVEVTLVQGAASPTTRFVVGAFVRESVGRMNEAALEQALSDAIGSGPPA